MDAINVYEALDSVRQGNARGVNQETASFLQENGLVFILSNSDYRRSASDAEKLPKAREDYESQNQLAVQYKSKVEGLDRKLSSRWHRFWSFRDTLDREQREREDNQASYETAEGKASEHEIEVKRLEGVQSGLEGYTQVDGCYAKPTDRVKDILYRLKARLPRLQGMSYQDFESELEQTRKTINSRYKRFAEMWDFLLDRNRRNKKETVQLAIALSKLPGTFEDIYERFRVVNSNMLDMNWKGFENYRIAASVVAQEGDINDLWESLLQTRNKLRDRGAKLSYALWSDAANVMKLSAEDPIARYDELGTALFGDRWKPNTNIPTKIQAGSKQEAQRILKQYQWNVFRRTAAAILAHQPGTAEEIAREYHSLKDEIHESGRRDSIESRISALILMGSTSSERVARLGEAFGMMRQYGWKNDIQWYPSAAALSIMPGTVEENVQWLQDVYDMLKRDKYKSALTSWATSLLVSGFRSLPGAPDVSVAASSDAYADDSCFDFESAIGGAVIGDLFDNGSLDFSDGAVAGGIVGGLIGDPITGGLVGLLFDDD